jgi:AraC-like DNA-binding protein
MAPRASDFATAVLERGSPATAPRSTVNSGMRVRRTPDLVADVDDGFFLALPTADMNIVTQLGREVAIADGEAVLMSNADLGAATIPETSRFFGVPLSRAALAARVPRLEDALMRRIPSDNAALRLLADYLNVVRDNHASATPELRRLVVAHVHDLVALAIGATRDAAAVAASRGMGAARLSAIKADIAGHLGRGNLSIAAVAARQQVTPRYVQMLFEGEGTSFSEFVRRQRLVRAYHMLSDPRYAGWTITAIAFEVGFGDLSYFNHAFRRLYAVSPSDVRHARPAWAWTKRSRAGPQERGDRPALDGAAASGRPMERSLSRLVTLCQADCRARPTAIHSLANRTSPDASSDVSLVHQRLSRG